jgi:hypothetical protein
MRKFRAISISINYRDMHAMLLLDSILIIGLAVELSIARQTLKG